MSSARLPTTASRSIGSLLLLGSISFGALAVSALPVRAEAIVTLAAIAGQYNVFVLGSMGTSGSPYTSDSEGPMAVGGNLFLQDFTVASSSANGGPALVVGGNVTQTRGTINGAVFIGGNANFTTNAGGTTVNGNLNVLGTLVSAPTQVTGTTSTGAGAGPLPINFQTVGDDLKAASLALATAGYTSQGLPGTVVQNGSQFTLTGTGAGINFFSMTTAQLSQLGSGSFTINLPAGATAIINVSGQTAQIGSPGNFGFFYNGVAADHVLFNFFEATTLSMQSFDGSILAPLATVTFTNGQMNGALMAGAVNSLTYQNGEFHNVLFEGLLPTPPATTTQITPVPEPASLLMFGAAGLILLLVGAVLRPAPSSGPRESVR